jgi:hypothetical protein
MLQLLFSGELTLLQSTRVGVVAGEPQAVTAAAVVRSWDASGSFACTSSRSVVRSTFRRCFPYSPPAVGFGFLRWSVAGCNLRVVQLSCLFEPHAMGANFCCRTFPCGFGLIASRFFSVSLKVLSQGNLRRWSLQGPRSATTGWLTDEHDT